MKYTGVRIPFDTQINNKMKGGIKMNLTKFRSDVPSFPSLWDNFLGRDLFDITNSSATGTTLPAVNIKESKDDYMVEVAAPGMKKEDFKITLDNNVLMISSEKETSHEEEEKDGSYSRREFSYQSFQRSFTLPNSVEQESISASYKDGVLMISIPKKEEAKQKPVKEISIM